MSVSRASRRRFLCVVAYCFLLAWPALPIVIIDSGTPGYITGNGSYTGVVEILFNSHIQSGTFICSGSLMADGIDILTAGHCVDGAYNWTVYFQTPSGTTPATVSQAFLHPDYAPRPNPVSQLGEYDVGLLRLAAPAPADAQRYGLMLDYDNVAVDLDLVGYGLGGERGGPILDVGTRRHAINGFDSIVNSFTDGFTTAPAPDHPFLTSLSFNLDSAEQGLINGGDSGGPALSGSLVLGVASYGDLPRTGSYPKKGTYDGGYASLAEPVTGGWVASQLVPEPATFLAMLGGVLLFWLRRTRLRRVVRRRRSPAGL